MGLRLPTRLLFSEIMSIVTNSGETRAFLKALHAAGPDPEEYLGALNDYVNGNRTALQPELVPANPADPYLFSFVQEALMTGGEKTSRGAFYTPPEIAECLAREVIHKPGSVLDPACGGGVFLIAAAKRLLSLGCGKEIK